MNKSKAKIVATLERDKDTQEYVIVFPGVNISPVGDMDLGKAMDYAAARVSDYRDSKSNKPIIDVAKAEIKRCQAVIQSRRAEIEQLESAESEDLPLYSLADPKMLALYKAGVDCLRPERVNYWEEQNDVTISRVNLVESPWRNIYRSPLLWQWGWLEDTGDESG